MSASISPAVKPAAASTSRVCSPSAGARGPATVAEADMRNGGIEHLERAAGVVHLRKGAAVGELRVGHGLAHGAIGGRRHGVAVEHG